MLLQVAGRTNDSAGDGTTTASVLARDMIHYGLQVLVHLSDSSPQAWNCAKGMAEPEIESPKGIALRLG